MYDFQSQLQGLSLGDFQATQAVPFDPSMYY